MTRSPRALYPHRAGAGPGGVRTPGPSSACRPSSGASWPPTPSPRPGWRWPAGTSWGKPPGCPLLPPPGGPAGVRPHQVLRLRPGAPRAAEIAAWAVSQGFTVMKVKVGSSRRGRGQGAGGAGGGGAGSDPGDRRQRGLVAAGGDPDHQAPGGLGSPSPSRWRPRTWPGWRTCGQRCRCRSWRTRASPACRTRWPWCGPGGRPLRLRGQGAGSTWRARCRRGRGGGAHLHRGQQPGAGDRQRRP